MTIPINLRVHPYYRGTKILDGNTYQLEIHWNINTEKWYLDIVGITNSIAIRSIALLPGKDLLAQHGQYELGQLQVVDNSGANENPDYDGIGKRWTLEYTPLA